MNGTNTARIAEFFSPASVDALNAILDEKNLDGSQIISVLKVPASSLVSPKDEQFRVLYRI